MNFEKLITLALLNNEKVVSVVAKSKEGIPIIHPNRNFEGSVPSIEFHQIAGGDVNFADDEPFIERNTFELTFYCKGNLYTDIRDELVKTLRGISFHVLNEYVVVNPYTDLTHYTLHIRSMIEEAYFDLLMNEMLSQNKQEITQTIPNGDYFDEDTGKDITVIDLTDDMEFLED